MLEFRVIVDTQRRYYNNFLVQGPLSSGPLIATMEFKEAGDGNWLGFDRGTIRLNTGNRFLIVRVVSIPYWAFIAFAGLMWCAGRLAGRLLRRRIRPGFCANCGYDLRASPRRCPECGAEPAGAIG
jgi:hypothetical protein